MNPTTPPDNTARKMHEATKPGRGMLYLRMGLLLALSIGLAVFGYFAVDDLLAYDNTPQQNSPGTLTYQPPAQAPTTPGQSLGQELVDSLTRGPTLPLDHDPAHLPPFPDAVLLSRGLVPDQSIAEENATYEVGEAQVAEVIDYYVQTCEQRGFTLADQRAMSQAPGGVQMFFLNGPQQQLTVSVFPQGGPTAPPMSPPKIIISVRFLYSISPRQP